MTQQIMNCEDENSSTTDDVIKKFHESDDQDELDYSSCDLYDFPTTVFNETFPIVQISYLILDYNNLQELPPLINKLVNLIELSINGNELNYIPKEIGELRELTTLSLNENCLSNFPDEIGDLLNLKRLLALGNRISVLPNTFTKLAKLEEVILDENKLCYLPPGFGNLTSLQSLEVCNNELSILPSDIGEAEKLEVLSCSGNILERVPDSITLLTKLRFLDLSHNKLSSLPDLLADAHNIEKLYLENNNLRFLPAWVATLPNLIEFTISDNALCDKPFSEDFARNSVKLVKLEAGANFASNLPLDIGCLKKLEYLHLGSTISELERSNFQNGNWIAELPNSFCELKNLKHFNINENQIPKLPDAFGDLSSLSHLDLGQNMLHYLPSSFPSLANLEFLQLSKNLLKALPDDIGRLQKLIDFRLDNNQLTEIPDSVGDIPCLHTLDLFNNELTQIPNCIGKLTSLKKLDLDQNNFKISLKKIPKILPAIHYPARDPNLKDNWRGQTRPDKMPLSGEVIKVEGWGSDDDEYHEEEEEVRWNENALRMALSRGKSMWRSHTGSDTRVADPQTETSGFYEENDDEGEDSNDDDNWICYASATPAFDKNKKSSAVEKVDSDEENWDDEIEEDIKFKETQATCQERTSKNSALIDAFQNMINRYPPSQQAFSMTACYDSLVYRKLRKQVTTSSNEPTFGRLPVVDGQFDDAEVS